MKGNNDMGISVIRGGASSGKSSLCLKQISEVHEKNPDAKCIMLVPDHYSYETERSFVDFFGGIGLNNIDVLTLRRMSINLLTARERNHLTPSGKMILIHKAVKNACEELANVKDMDMKLIASMRRQGFLEVMTSLLSEMKRYNVTPEVLAEKASSVSNNKTLKNKLLALACVSEKYTEYVEESGSFDSEDDLYRLASRIENGNDFDNNTYVWINRFDKFMPQQLCVIEALLKKGASITVSICCPVTDDENVREIYLETEKTIKQIYDLADIYGLDGEYTTDKPLRHLTGKDDLYTLFNNWSEDFVYPEIPQNMALFQSRDTYGEIERIACKIVDLVREDGYHFKDIALLCGDVNDYRHLTEAIFREYEIPYFTDRKIILSDHPIAMQILSLFGILEDDWSYEAVFRYLRAGFIYRPNANKTFYNAIGQSEIDALENYVLKYGIRGGSKWLSDDPWYAENDIITTAFAHATEQNSRNKNTDLLRREIISPIKQFKEKTKGRKTVIEFATALFEYLGDINLYNGLKSDIHTFRKKDMINEAEQFTKIWNLILDVLNQLTVTLKNDKINLSEFAEYINVGLSQCEIRTIPSGIDQVYVGDAERSSHTNIKIIFVVGAKNGTFPTGIGSEGFLSNSDRNILREEHNIELAPDTKKKLDEQYFKAYRALSAVCDKLYFSYSVQDEEGHSLSPSHLISDIVRKFPKIRTDDNLLSNPLSDGIYISSPQATIHRMLINMSARKKEKNKLWDIVYDWYKEKAEWKPMLSLIQRADYYDKRKILLDGDIAQLLYNGKIAYSASRINTFTSCPFEYFLKYGLNAKERDIWDVTPANIGTYAHEVINKFCLAVENGADTNEEKITCWRNLSAENRNTILNNIIEETCQNMLSSNVRDKERTANIFKRMGKTISNAAILIQKTLSAGGFAQNGMEYSFDAELSDTVSVRGIIDRIDICNDLDKAYVRIIDYKTGKTNFDIKSIYNGYNMQMIIYAIAAMQFTDNADISGIYYTSVRDEIKKLNNKITEDNIKEANEKALVLDGITFAEEDEKAINNLLYNIDNEFFKNGESTFTKLSLDDKSQKIKGLRTSDEINGLIKFVADTIVKADSKIRSGDISMSPYPVSTQSNACSYCPYSAVCRFDGENCHTRELETISDKEIWEIMKTKGAALKAKTSKGADKDA